MVQYDAKIIQLFAEGLYSRARSIVAVYSIFGLVGGFAAGAAITREPTGPLSLVIAALGLALGFFAGQQRAFALRLTAQQALCQVAIELNTRRSVPQPPPLS